MATETKVDCSKCGESLDVEEAENPRLDRSDGQPLCDDCWHEDYEFTCCCCQEYGDVKDQHNLIVVFETVDSEGGPSRKIEPGIYKITGRPYHGSPMIGSGYLFGDKLKRIGDVDPDMEAGWYPCGHLCKDCQAKVKAQFKGKCQGCKTNQPSCLRVQTGGWTTFTANGGVDNFRWNRAKVLCAACRHNVRLHGDKRPTDKHWRLEKPKKERT